MSPRVVRWVVVAVCIGGIAGMVVGSIADDNSVTLTFGLVTAAAPMALLALFATLVPTPAVLSGTRLRTDVGAVPAVPAATEATAVPVGSSGTRLRAGVAGATAVVAAVLLAVDATATGPVQASLVLSLIHI